MNKADLKHKYLNKYIFSEFFNDMLKILDIYDNGRFLFETHKDHLRSESQVDLQYFIENNLIFTIFRDER